MPNSGSIIRASTRRVAEASRLCDADGAFQVAEECLRNRQVAQALLACDEAERLGYDPDRCAGARWVCHMLLGEYSKAWQESATIERRGRPDPNRFWTGARIENRRVLVRCLHGLGDTVQYARFLPMLRSRASSVIVESQPSLKRLLAQSGLADSVITWKETEPAWDVQVEIVELPRIFEVTPNTIPAQVPYLKAAKREFVLAPRKLHVGLIWASGAYNRTRCIPSSILSDLCATPGCEFFSFQAGEEKSELEISGAIRDLGERDGDIAESAAKLLNMDLVISVDTMMAHLGGALGLPVWTLLPFEADWRWMLERADSPWYPTMRLFRQPRPGDWPSVIDQIAGELMTEAIRAA